MKLLYFPLIVGLGFSQLTRAQVKDSSSVKDKTILLPVEWHGNINPTSDAWSTGTTLTAGKLKVRGPFYGILRTNRDDVTASLVYPIQGIDSDAALEKVIEAFEKTNPKLKTKLLRKELSKYQFLPRGYYGVFKDGIVVSKEELNGLNRLKDTTYVYTFLYKSSDEKASLPGIFLIEKYGDFQYDERLEQEAMKKISLRVKEDTLETKVVEPTKPKPEIEDTTKHVPKIKEESDSLRKRLITLDEVYKLLLEKQKLSKITLIEKKDLERIIKERERISEQIEEKEAKKFDIGISYDFDNSYGLELRYGRGFKLGIGMGYSPSKTRNVISPMVNNFYGEGSEKTELYFIGPSLGIDLSKYLTLNLNLSLSIENKTVQEYIKRSNGLEVAQNKDQYDNKKPRPSFGLDFNSGNLGMGSRLSYDGNKWHAGLTARLRF